jgi:hypothetical protein
MSSQCKGYTKSGAPCKITIVLPNGYCRVHQDQHVVEKIEDTKEIERTILKVENETLEESMSKDKRENVVVKTIKTKTYVKNSSSNKRRYIVSVIVMVFFWILAGLLRKKNTVKR